MKLLMFGIFCCLECCYSWDFGFLKTIEIFVDYELCNSNWIINDIEGFRRDLKNKVFGQPFLESALLPLLIYHLDNENNPSKPLVLSFHGSPGTGKTFVSQLLGDHIFRKGRWSKFFKHYTMADVHNLSQEKLVEEIKNHAKRCPQTIFVFDEIEKMPDGTFEVIKSFLDYYHSVGKIDFRKTIFIFISNIGMDKINSLSKNLWDKGVQREDYKVSYYQRLLQESAYKNDGGLKGSRVVKNYLVDLYLPFLPLEREHIQQCIRAIDHEISSENIKKVIDELLFVPENSQVYSLTGCKVVGNIVRRYQRNHDEF